jgi:hypothetical protein
MKSWIYIVATMLFAIASVQAQIPEDFIRVKAGSAEGIEIVQERTFTKESLYGYMNGGAELYLEYGFDRLVVTDIVAGGNDLKIEAYMMPEAARAFGIYSVNVFRCDDANKLMEFYCQSNYQVQFCKGNYYVNIINNNGSSAGIKSARYIASELSELITSDSFTLSNYLPEEFRPENINRLLLISGDIALENNAYSYAKYLEGFSDYNMLIVEGDKKDLLIIEFESGAQIEEFRNSLGIEQFPACGELVSLVGINISLTSMGNIILHIDRE